MTKRGGKRRGAGRPAGSPNKELQEVRGLLELNRIALVKKAIRLALGDGGKSNVVLLKAFLDKLLPSLAATTASVEVQTLASARAFHDMTNEEIDSELLEYAEEIRKRRAGIVAPVPAGVIVSGPAKSGT